MNKHLASLVVVATIASIGVTSIPAAAETNLEHAISTITNLINSINVEDITTPNSLRQQCNDEIADTNLYTGVGLQTTSGVVTINVEIIGTTGAAAAIVGTTDAAVTVNTPSEVLDTLTFTKEITTTTAVQVVNNTLKNLSLNNYSYPYDIEEKIDYELNLRHYYNLDSEVHRFTLTPAVGTTTGSAEGVVVLTSWDDEINDEIEVASIPFNLDVTEGTHTTHTEDYDERYAALDDERKAIYEAFNNLAVSNDTTIDDIVKCATNAIKNDNIKVATVLDSNLQKSVDDKYLGDIRCKIMLIDNSNDLEEIVYFDKDIDTTATSELRSLVNNYLYNSLVASANMTEGDVLEGIKNAINDSTVKVKIHDFYLRKPISGYAGYCDLYVELKDSNNNNIYISYGSEDFTSKEGSDTSRDSGTSSSSHHSSGGSSSSSSSNSSSSTGSTSTDATGITNSSTGTTLDSTKPVSLANMSKEAVKAVENKVVSSISAVTGTVAGQTKEVETIDGTKVSITPITKDGKGVGSVITAETSSVKAVIPIDKDAAPIAAVYKFVPLLDKYIQVPDAVITADTITLPVEANAVYVVSPVVMSTTETITQGWVQSGSNWYMINATGDPLTGWQQDGTGWSYMSPTTGVMQTGWVQLGGNWYYLRNNGYMVTGWVKDGYNWYYLNEDGSMAYNTIVDGYKLGSNGAWIK